MKFWIVFALLFTGSAFAQTSRFPSINLYTGDPTGVSCVIPNSLVQSTTTGTIYSCIGGVYTKPTGVIGIPSGSNGQIQYNNNGVLSGSEANVDSAGNLITPSNLAAGATNGVLNASTCRYSNKPSWCSGSDVGAWINAAAAALPKITDDVGSTQIGTIIIDSSSSPYSWTTPITKPALVMLDCNGAMLNYTGTNGTTPLFMLADTSGYRTNLQQQGGIRNCMFEANSYITNPVIPTNTNILFFFGGHPSNAAGFPPSTAQGNRQILQNVNVAGGFGTALQIGNHAYMLEFYGTRFVHNTYNILDTLATQDSGENLNWHGGLISEGYTAGITLNELSSEWNFFGPSRDYDGPNFGIYQTGIVPWAANMPIMPMQVVWDSVTNELFQYRGVTQNVITGGSRPAFDASTCSATTADNTVTWTHVGQCWQPSTAYAQYFALIDTRGYLQVATTAGTSFTSITWANAVGATQADNTTVWTAATSTAIQTYLTPVPLFTGTEMNMHCYGCHLEQFEGPLVQTTAGFYKRNIGFVGGTVVFANTYLPFANPSFIKTVAATGTTSEYIYGTQFYVPLKNRLNYFFDCTADSYCIPNVIDPQFMQGGLPLSLGYVNGTAGANILGTNQRVDFSVKGTGFQLYDVPTGGIFNVPSSDANTDIWGFGNAAGNKWAFSLDANGGPHFGLFSGDTNRRFQFVSNACTTGVPGLAIGPGSSTSLDTCLYRSGAGVLAVPGTLNATTLQQGGNSVPTGPNSGTAAGDAVCYSNTTGAQQDCVTAAVSLQAPSFSSTSTGATATCSTSGGIIYSQPQRGSRSKEVVMFFNACNGNASITIPVAFLNAGYVFGVSSLASITTATTTTITVTGATGTSGNVFLKGY